MHAHKSLCHLSVKGHVGSFDQHHESSKGKLKKAAARPMCHGQLCTTMALGLLPAIHLKHGLHGQSESLLTVAKIR